MFTLDVFKFRGARKLMMSEQDKVKRVTNSSVSEYEGRVFLIW